MLVLQVQQPLQTGPQEVDLNLTQVEVPALTVPLRRQRKPRQKKDVLVEGGSTPKTPARSRAKKGGTGECVVAGVTQQTPMPATVNGSGGGGGPPPPTNTPASEGEKHWI